MTAPERDPLGVTISAREIYDQIVGLRDDVRSLVQSNSATAEVLDDHEDRIRDLEAKLPADAAERLTTIERWKYSVPITGIAAVLSAGAAWLSKSGA